LGTAFGGLYIGRSYWGQSLNQLTNELPASKVEEWRLESMFPTGIFPYWWIGGAAIIGAAVAVVLLRPPWTGRGPLIFQATIGLAICAWIIGTGFAGERVERSVEELRSTFANEMPSDSQMGRFCSWYTRGSEPEETLVFTGRSCSTIDVYVGQQLVDSISTGFQTARETSGIYPGGPIVSGYDVGEDRSGLVAFDWDGQRRWQYLCSTGRVEVINFSGSFGQASPKRRTIELANGETRYATITCNRGSELNIDVYTGRP